MPTTPALRGACPSRPRARERGFSLIELIVVMLLFGIAGALVVQVLVQGSSGAGSSRAAGISESSMRRTSDALSDDVARAVTRDNLDAAVRDDAAFASAVRSGTPLTRPATRRDGTVDMNATPVAADIDDVRIATPSVLQVIARDRCITWRAGAGRSGAAFELVRSVAPATNCSAATETRTFIRADAATSSLDRTPFEYDLVCHPAVCRGSRASGSTPCRPYRETGTVSGVQRRWIVGVDVRLFALTVGHNATGAAESSISQAIRSREIDSYREALGC